MPAQGYLRFPTIFEDSIVFTAEDDLWRVSAAGGRAERLTAGVAEATHAKFSPDGRMLAFVGRDEGPTEVYAMPSEGGEARRLTYEGAAALVVGWRPDGSEILYASNAQQPSRRMLMLRGIAPQGGEPTRLPYGIAHAISYGPGGAIVLGRNTLDQPRWKHYRGGTAGYLWVDAEGSGEFRRVHDLGGNITACCWVGQRIYFLSDHEGMGQVYSSLPDGSDLRCHTRQRDYYARNLASDGRRLVYHAGGDLYLLEPEAEEGRRLEVTLAGGRAQRARKFVPAGQYLDGFAPHPRGHSVALTTRGRAFALGAWDGPTLEPGEADGPRYRLVDWLADGKRVVTVSDDGTEAYLAVLGPEGNAPRVLDGLDVGHVLELRAAPNGERVLLSNHRGEILLVDVGTSTLRVLDRSPHARSEVSQRVRGLAWSPDGQWVAYAFAINPRQVAIKLGEVATGQTHQVTEPVLYDMQPAFDPAGRYLYFIGARDFDPVQDGMAFGWSFPRGMRPYLIPLRRDLHSPFSPAPEPPATELATQVERVKEEGAPAAPPTVRIDLAGIHDRVVAFPVAEGRYTRVAGTVSGAVFASTPLEGTRKQQWTSLLPPPNATLESYTFATRKQERIADGLVDFTVTADGKGLLYRTGDRLRLLPAGEKPPELEGEEREKPGRASGWVDLNRVKVSIVPEVEWRQMFGEAWRLQREQYWQPSMGGLDWPAIHARYAPLVERVASRAELSDLLNELQGELGSSHAYEVGGEYRPRPEYHQGHLGVDWRFDAATERFLIERIVRGDPWDAEATSPLLAPGTNVAVGDAVLAINGQRLTAARGPQQLLVNQAGNEVQLLVAPAGGGEPRTVSVRALESEAAARYRDWVEATRAAVRAATGGRVGYLHIPDMSSLGFSEFYRGFLLERDAEALIVDVRWNGGGIVSSLLLEKLMRPRLGYSYQRWGQPDAYFIEAPRGNLVAITDENAGSDGDIFSHAWKMLKLGPLVGQRTWGGVVGIEPYIALADGTITTQPEFAFWFADVGWQVENYGTEPTIPVEYPPQAYAAGRDPQLERAIAEALRQVEEHPLPVPTPPPPTSSGSQG